VLACVYSYKSKRQYRVPYVRDNVRVRVSLYNIVHPLWELANIAVEIFSLGIAHLPSLDFPDVRLCDVPHAQTLIVTRRVCARAAAVDTLGAAQGQHSDARLQRTRVMCVRDVCLDVCA
jgi:hypothetical protein